MKNLLSESETVLLQACPLFAGIAPGELSALLPGLQASVHGYAKGAYIYSAGAAAPALGVVLAGRVHVQQEDFWGARSIMGGFGPGQLFAETYALLPAEPMAVSVLAVEESRVLFLDVHKMLAPGAVGGALRARLVQNLLGVLARKNRMLTGKLTHMARRTTRQKLLSYLSAESLRQGSDSFRIPFDRQELADYLAVDRSALSAELGRLRDAGVLRFAKDRFRLLRTDEIKEP